MISKWFVPALGTAFTLFASAAPPNIVFFIADDISQEDPGCYVRASDLEDAPHRRPRRQGHAF